MDKIVGRWSVLFVCMAGYFMSALSLRSQASTLGQEFPWFARTAPRIESSSILVTGDWVEQRLGSEQVIPVDVRSSQRFALSHLPGAIHLGPPVPSKLNSVPPSWISLDQTLVLYGDASDRQTIGQVFYSLSKLGFKDLKVLEESFGQWKNSRGVEKTVSRRSNRKLPLIKRPSSDPLPVVTREELFGIFGRPGFEILDLRDPGGWGPLHQAPSKFSAGHIPNSLPFDPLTLFPENGWPGKDAIQKLVAGVSIRSADPIDLGATFVLYGENAKDPRLGLGFLALRILGLSAKVYSEGFEGWSLDDRAPVVQVMTAAELKSLLQVGTGINEKWPEGLVIFDLRETWDFDDGHIPGAINLPERVFSEQFEGTLRLAGPLDLDRVSLVFYCYGRECVRSRKCASLAAQKGFRRLYWLRDGMSAWGEISGPVVKSTANP